MITVYLVLAALGCVCFVLILWRRLSNRRSLPCPTWLGWMVERDNPFTRISRASFVVQHAGIASGMVLLDAGCGPGRVSLVAAEAVGAAGNVVAMDMQAGMLARTREKAQQKQLTNIEFLEGRLGEGKLKSCRFDRVLLVMVLGEIPNRQNALQEIFQALKPHGRLSVTETIFDPHFQRRSVVAQLAKAVGFQERAHFGGFLAYTLVLEKPPA